MAYVVLFFAILKDFFSFYLLKENGLPCRLKQWFICLSVYASIYPSIHLSFTLEDYVTFFKHSLLIILLQLSQFFPPLPLSAQFPHSLQ